MKRLILALMVVILGGCTKGPQPPVAEKIDFEFKEFNTVRNDPYHWMHDRNNPKVIDYLNAENAYTESVMKPAEKLQQKLYNEIVGRIKQDDASVPYEDNGYFYYTRFEQGKEYPVFCRKKGSLDAAESVMLDVNAAAKGFKLYKVNETSVSPDNKIFAYAVDTSGNRVHSIYLKKPDSGDMLTDVISNTSSGATWANDNANFFYTIPDETLRSYKVMRHKVGSSSASDVMIYHETDPSYSVVVEKSKSGRFIFITSFSTLSSEIRFLDAEKPDGVWTVLQPREKDLLYFAEHRGDQFIIRTNDRAKNFKIVQTPVLKPSKANWKDLIPHRNEVLVEGFEIFSNYLVVAENSNALPSMRVIRQSDKQEHYIDFGEEVYSAFIGANRRFDTETFRYTYTSLTTPFSTFDYSMSTREKKLMKEAEVVGGYDKTKYETKRLWATSSEGLKIPISIVFKKGLSINGANPLLLYAYGSYGYSMSPTFSSERLSLLDRGFVYAIAHVRGGQEMGRSWYEDGKLLKKKNTFTDFIACAEYLIAEKYTSADRLFANGGSAGGLLMGAVTNMRPDLFKGVIADVPWVDVISDMLDSSIPLTTLEFDEWGNPNQKEYYDYMLSYSPYDQVKAKAFPAILATGGLNDSQVLYWNPAKWVAKIRAHQTNKNVVLLKMNMGTGHSGASGRFERQKLTALKYAFMLDQLKITD